MPRLFYYCAALLLGGFWYVAWLISLLPGEPSIRARLGFPEPQDLLEPAFLLMCVVSLLLAVAFRRFVVRADTLPKALATAIVLPFIGGALWFAPFMLDTQSVYGIFSQITMLPLMGAFYGLPHFASSFWLILPMGLVSQLIMGAIGRGKLSSADRRLFLLTSTTVAAAVAYAAAFVPFR